jgi:type VI secretion system protein ImpL
MKKLFGFFKSRALVVILGLVLLSLVIWYAGPYFAFADVRPLESQNSRFIAIAVVFVLAAIIALLRRLRAASASKQLAQAVVRQQDAPAMGGAAQGEVGQLRERFEEAVAALQKSGGRRRSLYDLPWYVIIGPPGSGKTTALVNSGLNFPLSQRFGKEAVRGVGGTRNCDWWFTDEAVLLDTAGRYTTQDSDQTTDAAGWSEFLTLLRKYRKRRPLNGVLVAISASDLMTQSPADREANVAAVRRRLDELNRHLRLSLPVYFLVTKCDLVAGFNEYFDDLTQEGRAQVWGVTFPIEQTRAGAAASLFPAEFDALIERLNGRLPARLEEERDLRRRTALYAFPQQMAGLRDLVAKFVEEVFSSTRFDGKVLLRGVYFTSGTQEGTPIDRLMGAIGRTFALSSQAAGVPAGKGKAYFIERLLKQVVLGESGLAGVDRAAEVRGAALQVVTYLGLLLIAVGGIALLFLSFGRNEAYLTGVSKAIEGLAQVPEPRDGTPIDQYVSRFDALKAVADTANEHRGDVPFSMRWGLYQGNSIGNAANDAYVRELQGKLLPAVAADLAARLRSFATDPDKLYEYLKTYLMLGEPKHLDVAQLSFLVDLEWQQAYPSDPAMAQSLSAHFKALLDESGELRAMPLDESLVAQARAAIRQASVPALLYSRVKLNYAGDTSRALNLANQSGLMAERVLRRRSGASLSDPVPAIYTRDVFKEVAGLGTAELIKQFAEDSWVLGDEGLSLQDSTRLAFDVIQVYEQDYIRAWDAVLADVQVAPFQNAAQAAEMLGVLSGPTSPLRGFLTTVATQTNLTGEGEQPAAEAKAPAAATAAVDRLSKLFDRGKEAAGIAPAGKPGALVTAHFEPIRRLVAGPPGSAPIDPILAKFGQMQQQLNAVGSGLGETSPLEALAQSGRGDLVKSLQQDARQLPAPIGAMVAQIGGRSDTLVVGQARGELDSRYRQQVVPQCTEIVSGRYPFLKSSAVDVPLADFGRLFGYGGVFDTFFNENLAVLVDTSTSPWRTKPGAAGIAGSPAMLQQFELARRIRDTWFEPGGKVPQVRFTIVPTYLDAGADRMTLELDGQSFEYRHGPERNFAATWPGEASGIAALSLEMRTGERPNRAFEGPWAWFRLLDAGRLTADSDVRYQVSFAVGGAEARFTLEASSIRNPFMKADLQRFSCGS